MPIQKPANKAVSTDLKSLPKLSIHALRERWRELFRNSPPPAFGPDLLRRSIAQELQEGAYGTLSPVAQRELNRAVASLAKNPTARLELPRRIKAGAVLVRDWKTKSHRVMVLDRGFAYEGRTYPSLSEIAREITGTRWNGPRFFGLRPADRSSNQESIDTVPRKRGRPRKIGHTAEQSTTTEVGHGL
jgi:hypothetical protein